MGYQKLRSFRSFRDNSGTTALEYALIAAIFAVVILASINLIGTNAGTNLTEASEVITNAGGGDGGDGGGGDDGDDDDDGGGMGMGNGGGMGMGMGMGM